MERKEKEKALLESLLGSRKIEHRYNERLSIILRYEQTGSKRGVSRDLSLDIQKVRRWIDRWLLSELIREELYESYLAEDLSTNSYKKELTNLVNDKTRSGKPPIFTLAEKEKIVALASTDPSDLDLPFTHWSGLLLQGEVIARGIVKNISVRQIGRFLKSAPPSTSPECLLGMPKYRRLG